MYEKIKIIGNLKEHYEEEKHSIQQKLHAATDQLEVFRRETDDLLEQVHYLTRTDQLDLTDLHWQFMSLADDINHEGRSYYEYLADKQLELKQTFNKAIDHIEEEARQAAKNKTKKTF
ncbi:hypothetical protein ACSFB8_09185 [Enterococcus faecalis]